MASPERVELSCPNCGSSFWARSMGSSYYIAGIDTDLREKGSIEDVRRYSLASCPYCTYSDYTWEFQTGERLPAEEQQALAEALGIDPSAKPAARNRPFGDFERLSLARTCFSARGLAASSRAELALLGYYVARDLGRRDIEPELRDESQRLFVAALQEELPGPLLQRYAYLAGELARRGGQREDAVQLLERALSVEAGDPEWDPEGRAWDIERLARRMHASVLHAEAEPEELLELIRAGQPEVAHEACRILSGRRTKASLEPLKAAWGEAPSETRTGMLRELTVEPHPAFADVFREAIQSPVPDDVRLAARGLAELGQGADEVLAALRRGVLSTEAALTDALRRLNADETPAKVKEILAQWEAQAPEAADEWYFGSDPTPLRSFLYTSGTDEGRDLLVRDLCALDENDLWDKVPSGGPVSAALAVGDELAGDLVALLGHENAATRRWSCYLLAELRQRGVAAEIAPLLEDPDQVVRLQAATALARLGDPSHEEVVLEGLRELDEGDLPFALHFLVPFQSDAIKAYLFELLESELCARSELLPLIGRQAPDDRTDETLNTSLLELSDDTRAGAVTGLSFRDQEQIVERLRLLYDQEDSDEVLRRIVHGLGRLARNGHRRQETTEFLRERLESATPRLRFPIAHTLLTLDDPTGIDVVRERAALFHESPDRYDLVAPALKALAEYERRRA